MCFNLKPFVLLPERKDYTHSCNYLVGGGGVGGEIYDKCHPTCRYMFNRSTDCQGKNNSLVECMVGGTAACLAKKKKHIPR